MDNYNSLFNFIYLIMYKPNPMSRADKLRLKASGFIKDRRKRPSLANVSFFINGQRRQIIHRNLPVSMAFAIKNKIKHHPSFKVGEVRVEYI